VHFECGPYTRLDGALDPWRFDRGVVSGEVRWPLGGPDGLLDAVAAHGFTSYPADKTALRPTGDPVEDLRAGWDLHVGLGLANPALYTPMYGR
jgi:hypothetical protein